MSDRESGAALSGARVRIVDGDHAGLERLTGQDGRYRFEGVAGTMNLSVTAEGYHEQRAAVDVSQDRTLDFALEPLPPKFVLEGQVRDEESGEALSGALVWILDGDPLGLVRRTGDDGRYRFEEVAGSLNLLVTADGYRGRRAEVEVDRDLTLDLQLERLPRGSAFGAGRWLVNREIAPGRYFADPVTGCFWERLGEAGDILASEFLGFDAGQEIVDIDPSDHVFHADVDCRRWRPVTTASAPAGTIPAGRWLVGRQVQPGVYETDARAGCYWARLRRFSGETRLDVIDNEFLSDSGRRRVEVQPTDAGFYSDADCGTWTLSVSAGGLRSDAAGGSPSEIERNRELYRLRRQLE